MDYMSKREELQFEIKNTKYSFGELGKMSTDEQNFYTSLEELDYRFIGCPNQYKSLKNAENCSDKDCGCTIDAILKFRDTYCVPCWRKALGE